MGIIMAILAGAAMSVQGVMNTRLSDKIGLLESNAFVQGTAFLLAALAAVIFGKGNLKEIAHTPVPYLLGGVLGLVITLTVMLAIKKLNTTFAVSCILISQLTVAAVIDAFGILEAEKVPFTWLKIVAIVLMTAGIVLFQWKTT